MLEAYSGRTSQPSQNDDGEATPVRSSLRDKYSDKYEFNSEKADEIDKL